MLSTAAAALHCHFKGCGTGTTFTNLGEGESSSSISCNSSIALYHSLLSPATGRYVHDVTYNSYEGETTD